MSEESIFSSDQDGEAVVQNPPVADIALPPEVQEFVGEGKKYKSLQDALKSIPHAQTHIQKLEQELTEAKTAAAKVVAMEELLEEINKSKVQPAPQSTPASSGVQDIDLDSVVEKALARKEAQRVAQANAQEVIEAFQAKFGDKSEAEFIRLAQENGLSIAHLNMLAQTSPQAVLKLAGLSQEKSKGVPHSSSSVKTEGQFTQNNQELSAKVSMVGASTKDVLNAWQIAKQKAINNLTKGN